MGVPGHDTRDSNFAKENNLPSLTVFLPLTDTKNIHTGVEGYEGIVPGYGEFSGLSVEAATVLVLTKAEFGGYGAPLTSFRLRDWLISRQVSWGDMWK